MSALPKISPQTTALSASVPTMQLYNTTELYDVFPSRLTTAPDNPKRINPLNPPPPQKRTVAWETRDPHWHNEQRAMRMKQREHYRYHHAWSKYYYGSVPEQEQYRAYTRGVLKQQMSDQWKQQRQHQEDKVVESERAVAFDSRCREEDFHKHQQKSAYLKKFTEDNKTLMENSWQKQKEARRLESLYDREQLKYNPINWSSTLK